MYTYEYTHMCICMCIIVLFVRLLLALSAANSTRNLCAFSYFQLIDFWTPNKLIDIDGKEKEWLPPKGKHATNYANSEAMRYEAEAVRQSIIAGDVENKNVSYADSLLFAEIEDTIRRQIGVLNKFDEE